MRKDFCIFILSHGRANNILTTRIFDRNNYTGKWYLIVDNEDETIDEYIKNFGIDYRFSKELVYKHNVIKTHIFDDIIDLMIKFFEVDKRILSLTIAQGGDYIGGAGNKMGEKIRIKRKAMNSFLCSTDRPFKFLGNINEDVNTYCLLGQMGHIFIMLNQIALQQIQTQKQEGGLTTAYLNYGTYVKSFYSVLYCPSFVKISTTGYVEKRIHHKISWKNAVPCILNEKYKKS